MADPITPSSELVSVVTFACESSIALQNTVNSFQSPQTSFRDLGKETEALSVVLETLYQTIANDTELDLTALKLPLMRCGKACKEVEEKITRSTRRSNGVKDWGKLTYQGEDITQFRHILAAYKSTINIVLADANLWVQRTVPSRPLLTEGVAAKLPSHRLSLNSTQRKSKKLPPSSETVSRSSMTTCEKN